MLRGWHQVVTQVNLKVCVGVPMVPSKISVYVSYMMVAELSRDVRMWVQPDDRKDVLCPYNFFLALQYVGPCSNGLWAVFPTAKQLSSNYLPLP
jgi:hypothetical protein